MNNLVAFVDKDGNPVRPQKGDTYNIKVVTFGTAKKDDVVDEHGLIEVVDVTERGSGLAVTFRWNGELHTRMAA